MFMSYLEALLVKATTDVPKALLVVHPEWKERDFWGMIK